MRNNQKIPKGWSVKKLEECFSFSAGGDVDKDCFSETKDDLHPYPIYANALTNEGLYGYSSKYKVKEECITITGRGDIGNVFYRKGYFTPIVRLITAIPNAGIKAKFMSYACSQIHFFDESTGVPQLTVPQVQWYKILLPPLPEQEKIALVLGTWDEAIEKLSDLIEQKKLLKKGLMQKLIYTRTNATKYKVADLFELGRGRVISKNEIDTHQGVFPVYSSQTSDNGILGYINTYDFQGEYITWTTDGANAGEVFYRNGKFNCTNVCGTAKAKEKNVNLYYAMSFLNHVSKKYVSYVGNPKLMNGVFAIIPLILPDIEIQNKVAAILSTADDEINLLNQKLEAIKEQKKGLMQQLLTGQIRVKGN